MQSNNIDASIAYSYDVVVIGGGVAGINSAYYLQSQGPPGTSYVILEARDSIGGTWDHFKYPGVRCDSDVYSLGFSWNPWTKPHAIATAPDILEYLQASTTKYGIDRHIALNHKVVSANWSSEKSSWTLQVSTNAQALLSICARFVILGTGYYNYESPLQPAIPDLQKFRKSIIYPQFWPRDVDYSDKTVVIIGSGATAVTLLPSLAQKARHTIMLQRTPSYILTLPRQITGFRAWLRAILPSGVFVRLLRLQFMLATAFLYHFCMAFPLAARRFLERSMARCLPPGMTLEPDFKPPYDPWQQRLCISPDGDFFEALRCGRASVLTGSIQDVSENKIHLHSGQDLEPDIVVVATGLDIRFAGGVQISVDSCPIEVAGKYAYKGCMLQDVPNLAFVIGYAHTAWTLGAEVTATLVCRLLARMEQKEAAVVIPTKGPGEAMPSKPVLPLTSTYLQAADQVFPKCGTGQWKPRWNYFFDYWAAKWGDLETDLVYM